MPFMMLVKFRVPRSVVFLYLKENWNIKFFLGGSCRSEKVENNQWSALLEQKVTNCASSEECPSGKLTNLQIIFNCKKIRLNLCFFTFGNGATEGCMREQASLEFDLPFGDVLLHKLVQAY